MTPGETGGCGGMLFIKAPKAAKQKVEVSPPTGLTTTKMLVYHGFHPRSSLVHPRNSAGQAPLGFNQLPILTNLGHVYLPPAGHSPLKKL
jgi:hypothetical protein